MSTQNKNNGGVKIQREDYPALYQAADQASVNAQWWHLFFVRLYLGALIASALFSAYVSTSRWSAVVATILFLMTLGLAILQAFKNYDETWYNGRAVAESVKTSTWRYMMCAEPYASSDSEAVVRNSFCNDIAEILKQNRSLAEHLGGDVSTKPMISEKMNAVRSMCVEDRLDVYNRERIDDQRSWYASKYKSNKKRGERWFYLMIGLHAIAVVMLLVKIARPEMDPMLPTQAVIVSAGSVLTWIQVKNFKEHSSAYSLTAHEIGIIKQGSEDIEDEEDLSDFVKDAENAFSREHTQWAARKDR